MSTIFVFLFISSMFLADASAKCPPGATQGLGDECYLLKYDSDTWVQAEESCVRESGHLASVTNAFVNGFVSDLPNKRYEVDYWLGGSAGVVSDGWSWSDLTAFTYTNWAQGQPSSDAQCLVLNVTTSLWYGGNCQQRRNYICKIPSVISASAPNTAAPAVIRCPSKWTFVKLTNKCYRAYHDRFTLWKDAEQACVDEGAHLVSVHSPEEQQFIWEIAGTCVPMLCWSNASAGGTSACDNGVWIGLNDYKNVGVYEWSDGSKFDYSNWHVQPGQHETPQPVAFYADAFIYGPYNDWAKFWSSENPVNRMRAFVCNKKAF